MQWKQFRMRRTHSISLIVDTTTLKGCTTLNASGRTSWYVAGRTMTSNQLCGPDVFYRIPAFCPTLSVTLMASSQVRSTRAKLGVSGIGMKRINVSSFLYQCDGYQPDDGCRTVSSEMAD